MVRLLLAANGAAGTDDIEDYRGKYDRRVQYYIDRGLAVPADADGNPVHTPDDDTLFIPCSISSC